MTDSSVSGWSVTGWSVSGWSGDRLVRERLVRERGRTGQNGLLQLTQLLAGFQTQLLDQHLAAPAEDLERVGLAPRAIEGEHQLATQPLAQRVLGNRGGELADQLAVPAEAQLDVEALLQGGHLVLGDPVGGRAHYVAVDALQRRPTPERQRRPVPIGRLAENLGLAGRVHAALVAVQVEAVRRDAQQVTGRPRLDRVGQAVLTEQPAQRGNGVLNLGTAGRGRRFAVDRLGEPAQRDHPAGLQEQGCQHDIRAHATDVHSLTGNAGLEHAQYREVQSCPTHHPAAPPRPPPLRHSNDKGANGVSADRARVRYVPCPPPLAGVPDWRSP